MSIDNIPDIYLKNSKTTPEVFVYDFKMTEDSIKTKVNLNRHMFSFLQTGKKQVHFANTSVLVNNKQSLLIKKGNCLWTELLDKEDIYYCKLLFFSDECLKDFLNKYFKNQKTQTEKPSYFAIENDDYILAYINSLSSITTISTTNQEDLFKIKFEELLLYLSTKYNNDFTNYLLSLIQPEKSSFKTIIEQNIHSTLSLEEIAFLCNMSLSTFKRHFIKEYNESPGKWLREKRLIKAKTLLEKGKHKPSEIFHDLGYNNLSNFSTAFKRKFGLNPSEI